MSDNLEEANENEVISPSGFSHDTPRQEHIGRTARSASNSFASDADNLSGAAPSKASAGPAQMPASVKPSRSTRRGVPRARRMNLSVTHISAWSMAKVTFLLSIAGGIIQIVAVALVWGILNVAGVFSNITQIFSSAGLDASTIDLASILSLSTVLSAVTIFSIIEVVLVTLLVAIVTLLYNVVTALVGGVHVTLGDD